MPSRPLAAFLNNLLGLNASSRALGATREQRLQCRVANGAGGD